LALHLSIARVDLKDFFHCVDCHGAGVLIAVAAVIDAVSEKQTAEG
jgi:hypothetical protein